MPSGDTSQRCALVTDLVTVREFDAHRDEDRERFEEGRRRFDRIEQIAQETQSGLATLAERHESIAKFVKVALTVFATVSSALVLAGIVAAVKNMAH